MVGGASRRLLPMEKFTWMPNSDHSPLSSVCCSPPRRRASACLGHRGQRGDLLRDGKITGVRHTWVFDEMYRGYAVQGLGKDEAAHARGTRATGKTKCRLARGGRIFRPRLSKATSN